MESQDVSEAIEQSTCKGKRKGLGGLSPEKKSLLKKIIMEKAREEMHKEALRNKDIKENEIRQRVESLNTEGLNKEQLENLCKKLQDQIKLAHGEIYDWEVKIRKIDVEISELTMKIKGKGRFVKPLLRKVNRSVTSKLAKMEKLHQAQQQEHRAT